MVGVLKKAVFLIIAMIIIILTNVSVSTASRSMTPFQGSLNKGYIPPPSPNPRTHIPAEPTPP